MLSFPDDWIQHAGANVTTAFPPVDTGVRARYFEQLAARPTVAEIVDAALGRCPELRVISITDPVRTITDEGELGARTVIDGELDGRPARLVLAATFMDDVATVLEGLATSAQSIDDVEGWVTARARRQVFGIASRPRRFFYSPPDYWQALPRGLFARWYPPTFPADPTTIEVAPALPDAGASDPVNMIATAMASLGAGLGSIDATREELGTMNGLTVRRACVVGDRAGIKVYREAIYLTGGGWSYRVQLETANLETAALETNRATLLTIVESVEPLPVPARPDTTAIRHWGE